MKSPSLGATSVKLFRCRTTPCSARWQARKMEGWQMAGFFELPIGTLNSPLEFTRHKPL